MNRDRLYVIYSTATCPAKNMIASIYHLCQGTHEYAELFEHQIDQVLSRPDDGS